MLIGVKSKAKLSTDRFPILFSKGMLLLYVAWFWDIYIHDPDLLFGAFQFLVCTMFVIVMHAALDLCTFSFYIL